MRLTSDHTRVDDDDPPDELTRLAQTMIQALPEGREIFALVLLREGDRGGAGYWGFGEDENDERKITMLLANLEVLLASHGASLSIIPVQRPQNAEDN